MMRTHLDKGIWAIALLATLGFTGTAGATPPVCTASLATPLNFNDSQYTMCSPTCAGDRTSTTTTLWTSAHGPHRAELHRRRRPGGGHLAGQIYPERSHADLQ